MCVCVLSYCAREQQQQQQQQKPSEDAVTAIITFSPQKQRHLRLTRFFFVFGVTGFHPPIDEGVYSQPAGGLTVEQQPAL